MFLTGCAEQERSAPARAYDQVISSLHEGDYGAVYDAYSSESQNEMDQMFAIMLEMSASMDEENEEAKKALEEFQGMEGRELFVALMNTGTKEENAESFVQGDIVEEEIGDSTATLSIENDEGSTNTVELVREDDQWKIDKVQ
jgi:hypothetical protein